MRHKKNLTMSNSRKRAIESVINREPVVPKLAGPKVSAYYASNVFNDTSMREFLSEEAFNSIQNSMNQGTIVERKMA